MLKVVYSPSHLAHDTSRLTIHGQPFFEVPARAELIRDALAAGGWCSFFDPQDHGTPALEAVHTPDYLHFLATIGAAGQPDRHTGDAAPVLGDTFAPAGSRHRSPHPWALMGRYAFDIEAPIYPGTWSAALASAQCALTAADLVLGGERAAYALCRPPGHHAMTAMAGGYCYLNNAAIVARFLQQRHGGMRVAILDFDFHHGNGTQEIFYADPSVLYVSLHGDPDEEYPFHWGGADERGEGAGLGANINVPLPMGTDDARYLDALDDTLASIREHAPIFLIVSVGFDIAVGDPAAISGGFKVTADGFRAIGERVRALDLPTVLIQEGGYRLDTLAENATAFLGVFGK